MKSGGLILAGALGALCCTPVSADETLAKSRNCLFCHAVDNKLVGPAFKDIAARYSGQRGAQARLAQRILSGGKGVWVKELGSEIPMPPSTLVKQDEAARLSKWILALKKERN